MFILRKHLIFPGVESDFLSIKILKYIGGRAATPKEGKDIREGVITWPPLTWRGRRTTTSNLMGVTTRLPLYFLFFIIF